MTPDGTPTRAHNDDVERVSLSVALVKRLGSELGDILLLVLASAHDLEGL